MTTDRRIVVAGSRGMVGSAVMRRLAGESGVTPIGLSREIVDFRDRAAVYRVLAGLRADSLVIAAAKVGGIEANRTQPVAFLTDNLDIQSNLISGAHAADVPQIVFLGSSCIYPKFAEQPIREESLLTGPLEPTNDAYALAKITGIRLCEAYEQEYGRDYRSVMPTNLYGPGDNFDPTGSHVIPGMMRRFDEAREADAASVTVWGSGTPRREFLHVDDLADAVAFVLALPRDAWESATAPRRRFLNVGCGEDLSIAELADLIALTVGFRGSLEFDRSKPDGTPRKLLDVTRINSLGWRAGRDLAEGLRASYDWFRAHLLDARR